MDQSSAQVLELSNLLFESLKKQINLGKGAIQTIRGLRRE